MLTIIHRSGGEQWWIFAEPPRRGKWYIVKAGIFILRVIDIESEILLTRQRRDCQETNFSEFKYFELINNYLYLLLLSK